jgi:hypothetical protein
MLRSERWLIVRRYPQDYFALRDAWPGRRLCDMPNFSGSDLKRKSHAMSTLELSQRVPVADLVVGTAIDAVKEAVTVPWQKNLSDYAGSNGGNLAPQSGIVEFGSANAFVPEATAATRVLYTRHFVRAQQNVQPSAGERARTQNFENGAGSSAQTLSQRKMRRQHGC